MSDTQISPILRELVDLSDNQLGILLDNLSDNEAEAILYDWSVWARESQKPPKEWGQDKSVWLIQAGRGYGKTRVICETIRAEVESGRAGRVGIIAETAADARDIIVEGESGLLAISPNWFMPKYEPSKRRLTWSNGARATLYSAEDPEQVRGPQHDLLACDEIGKWRYGVETWDNAMLGLRLGYSRCVAGTTPRRTALFLQLTKDGDVIITYGTTYENMANLSDPFINRIVKRYEGTRKGKQELYGLLLEEIQGALWSEAMIDAYRIKHSDLPVLEKVVVSIDPAATSNPDSDETGIIVAGRDKNGHGYILADATCQLHPAGWAKRAIEQYKNFEADHITPEVNNGGEMVEHTIHSVDNRVPVRPVRASRGKITRAEPISTLYEDGKIHHVGTFALLEEQMTNYVQGATKSPDRLDALVWALTDLFPNETVKEEMTAF